MKQEELLEKAFTYYENGDIKQAVDSFESLADLGNLEAQFCMARFYWSGNEFVNANDEKALYYYEQTAEKGHALAQLWLGNAYMYGSKCDIDYTKAVYWYEKAINSSIANAQYHLGLCYHYGLGVKKDENRAYRLIEMGAANNFLPAQLFISDAISDKQYKKEYMKKIVLMHEKKKHVNNEIAKQLADAYMSGVGLDVNYKKAYELYSLPVLSDSVEAIFQRANCLENGLGINKDVSKALSLYESIATKSLKAQSRIKMINTGKDN